MLLDALMSPQCNGGVGFDVRSIWSGPAITSFAKELHLALTALRATILDGGKHELFTKAKEPAFVFMSIWNGCWRLVRFRLRIASCTVVDRDTPEVGYGVRVLAAL